MKLRNIIFIILGLEWLLFLLLTFFAFKILFSPELITVRAISSHLNYFFDWVILFALILQLSTLWLMHVIIFKRIEKINDDIKVQQVSEGSFSEKKSDELSAIAMKFNVLKEAINKADTYLDQRIQERTQELESVNAQLQQEISEHELTERELIIHKEHLVRLAHYDNLTSLPNRVFFNEMLNKALNNAKRHNKILAILFINLDHFKIVNTKYNHKIGNLVLKELGQRLKGILRTDNIIARLGGDEFIILLNDIENPKFVGAIANKLLYTCKQPMRINSHAISVTASIGVSIFPNDGQSLEDLQMHADMAMYRAKHAGGDNYQYYGQAMDIAAHEHMKLEATLRHAIEHNEFVLHYQPQLDLQKGIIKSVEALIRWHHPVLGLLGPEEFIHFAEETGLIMPIGEWVLREACLTNKAWQNEGYNPIMVAVNISPLQFHQQDITKLIANVLKESNLSPSYLGIEITETAMMDNIELTVEKLKSIHAMGVRIAIDDFGTGYTSINYLKEFPIDILKIDQSFIKGIPHIQNDVAITSAVIALGHNLGLQIVAEGVETTEQIQFLAEQKCDLIQGYFLSRPLPRNKIVFQFTKKGKTKDSFVVHDKHSNEP